MGQTQTWMHACAGCDPAAVVLLPHLADDDGGVVLVHGGGRLGVLGLQLLQGTKQEVI
jgi:hypothetical protein